MGYVRGIERKDTSTLVYKLTGKYPRDIEREKNEKRWNTRYNRNELWL